ncbi:CobW family GTP-binding protein [Streptomyces stelliscabiei]|uniref:CobW family GTP-binding protein n=1 Tax=Streptomyces stelliscabiei TaxID=146820 RepID=UPI0029B466C7|nr:GTP-binding protein [Streptomyces stelliscabiei]MDX2661018.1 GTP-binding protein [Streptomyces stelliscabiei]MDX2715885.1 GTP-binding protein [Streptomyces stelliscabiei]MDX2789995.1 GTP-binding protein [Streptomyces stelliscabiei]
MREESRLPVVIVAGLHADARQHVVDRLLRAVPGSVALLHDLATAAEGTVRRILRDASGVLASGETPLVNDCACCALREDLVPELERLAGHGLTRLAIVELWDSVEPKAMAEVVAAHSGDDLTLTNVITAVDPALVLPYLSNGDDLAEAGLAAAATDQRTVGDTWARQLEYAPVLALVDSEDADEHDHALLTQLHPTARHVDALSGELAHLAFTGFDVEAAAAAQHPACALLPQEADEAGVTTLVWHRTRPFHPERLYQALEDLCCAAARSRGRFWLADRPDTLLSWDAAGGALCVEGAGPWLASLPDAAWELVPPVRRAAAALDWHPEHGDRCQHLVFTSPGLDRSGIEQLLDSCLLTDAEYAAGPEGWQRLPAAFDSLLDAA